MGNRRASAQETQDLYDQIERLTRENESLRQTLEHALRDRDRYQDMSIKSEQEVARLRAMVSALTQALEKSSNESH